MFHARLVTALLLLAGFIAAMFLLPGQWWAALLLVVLAGAGWEWGALAGFSRVGRFGFVGLLLVSAIAVGFGAGSGPEVAGGPSAVEFAVYSGSVAFWILFALPWLIRHWQVRSPLALAAAGWMVLVPAWLALARLQAEPAQLLALMGIVWIADTGAYVAGRAWGKHPLAPRISPAKSWEGVAGACAAVAVYYVVLSNSVPEWQWWEGWGGAMLFAGVTLMSVVGDLFESWFKRQAGVKDSGSLLPGHGGILDRVDSVTSSMPAAALLLHYIL